VSILYKDKQSFPTTQLIHKGGGGHFPKFVAVILTIKIWYL